MKHFKGIIAILLAVSLFAACDSEDDDSNLTRVERSLVGYWQMVEHWNYSHQEPIDGIQVIVFKSDRTQSFYKNGQLQYETPFWAKPIKDHTGYYLCHRPDEDYSQSTYSCSFEINGSLLSIWESGCFNTSKTVYQRISSLHDANPEVGVYHYEDNPTTLEGTWHLAKIAGGYAPERQITAGEVTVYFNPNHTMQVLIKSETEEKKLFKASGFYSYEIIKTETNQYDGILSTTINLDGEQCTYWFKDGMMVLDYGMAYDAPCYYFKKLKFANE